MKMEEHARVNVAGEWGLYPTTQTTIKETTFEGTTFAFKVDTHMLSAIIPAPMPTRRPRQMGAPHKYASGRRRFKEIPDHDA